MRQQAFKCTFKSSDNNYIDALTRIYPDIAIEECYTQGVKIQIGNRSFKELKEVVNGFELGSAEVELTITASDAAFAAATKKVFPEFKPQAEYSNLTESDCKRLQQTIDVVKEHLSVTRSPNSQSYMELAPTYQTKEDAWKVLNAVYAKEPFLTAIDMPSKSCIFILTANGTFVLEYDHSLDYNAIKQVPSPGFDIDNGFVSITNQPGFISEEMKYKFNLWKLNGYKGNMFPSLNPAPVVDKKPVENASVPKFYPVNTAIKPEVKEIAKEAQASGFKPVLTIRISEWKKSSPRDYSRFAKNMGILYAGVVFVTACFIAASAPLASVSLFLLMAGLAPMVGIRSKRLFGMVINDQKEAEPSGQTSKSLSYDIVKKRLDARDKVAPSVSLESQPTPFVIPALPTKTVCEEKEEPKYSNILRV